MLSFNTFLVTLTLAVSHVAAQCPWGYTALNGGTRCQNANYCQALGGTTYECLSGQCCRINGLCNSQEIAINGMCYPMAVIGERCNFSAQCQPLGSTECVNGVCRTRNDDNRDLCANERHIMEYVNNQPKNCMYNQCSSGYGCEYSVLAQQYICCGLGPGSGVQYDSSQGRARMYPGTNMPLLCSKNKPCMFDDTPNCVVSRRYKQNVCCSTFAC